MDRRYLINIAENYGGARVGIETIAAALSEPRDAIEEIIEPFLIQKGLHPAHPARAPDDSSADANAWIGNLGLDNPPSARQSQSRAWHRIERYPHRLVAALFSIFRSARTAGSAAE